ncbi:hypothetical protein ABZ656_10465 [Streptomyces sp. NPDC007095]
MSRALALGQGAFTSGPQPRAAAYGLLFGYSVQAELGSVLAEAASLQ